MPKFPTIIAVQAVLCQMTRFATVMTILTVSGYMASSSAIITSWRIIAITQMWSFALVAKWPLLEVLSSLFTSLKLF